MSDDHDQVPDAQGDSSLVRLFLHGRAGQDDEVDPAAATRIRPFLVTQGRTSGAADIPVEAQVQVTTAGLTVAESLSFEYRDVVNLCQDPMAVVEIAARLNLHLGVARVIIGDLTYQGLVSTYQPDVDVTDDVETIMRVIDGLRQRT
jgi:Protein of unknown function (DUF742)